MKRILNIETIKYLGKEVKVAGWVQTIRAHGKILFIDLRDRSGLVQIVFSPNLKSKVKSQKSKVYELAQELRPEWVIEISGMVNGRPKGMKNPKIKTGGIEIQAESLEVFSKAKTLPFPIDTPGYEINEEKRLKYRYLDLRRERIRKNLEMRQKVIQFIRFFN
jgi:aspartyl-tRNA synthetase